MEDDEKKDAEEDQEADEARAGGGGGAGRGQRYEIKTSTHFLFVYLVVAGNKMNRKLTDLWCFVMARALQVEPVSYSKTICCFLCI